MIFLCWNLLLLLEEFLGVRLGVFFFFKVIIMVVYKNIIVRRGIEKIVIMLK